ncbi:tryptophan 2,3-dioxygenase [Nocardiopsis suaedae]|uniref:Tryptophan 2,3-dioxygenase n=1 Tax=Nocardiopsis suaedae TaxID=3018444 RepID=A0ABT4TEH7_9ACTN|nr:tryptophan 2,3-dioxygenase family protein [Nocardiopsis suaedae]MDA2803108.1 tryptophan 2,3-dioxygenase family protein [Nocardiopsis suaedae]
MPIPSAAERRREKRAARTGGEPELDIAGDTPYARYGAIDTLLDLQRPRTDEPSETSFIIATQVMELLFTLLAGHWERARDAMEEDDVPAALAELRRGAHVQDVLVSSWDLLADLSPTEFSRFRDALGDASGFQSHTYRRLEFLLGNTSEPMVRPHKGSPRARAELERAMSEPGLYDAALRLLARRGLPVPEEALERDRARPYAEHDGVRAAWARVYADDTPGNDLFTLAEALLDTAERVTRWRQRHLAAVKRSMGAKPGTGGSNGLRWLAANAAEDVFPELWSLRTEL